MIAGSSMSRSNCCPEFEHAIRNARRSCAIRAPLPGLPRTFGSFWRAAAIPGPTAGAIGKSEHSSPNSQGFVGLPMGGPINMIDKLCCCAFAHRSFAWLRWFQSTGPEL
jgi:hypothetical protein